MTDVQALSHPILYSFRRCPYAMRARLMLHVCQLQVQLREILLKNKPVDMLNSSPKGTVPVLITRQGVIDESLDIMCWALEKINQTETYQLNLSLPLIQQNDDEFKVWLDKYKYFERHPQQSQEFYRRQAVVFLQQLEDRLNKGDFLLGNTPSLADYAIFPFVRQFAGVDEAWFAQCDFLALRRWLQYWLQHSHFIAIMPKFKPWHPSDEPIFLPLS